MPQDERSTMTPEPTTVETHDEYLLAQVREAFSRVVYSHKTHEKQADLCFRKHRWQQGLLAAFTALSTGTFLAAVLGLVSSPVLTRLVTSAIAIVVSALIFGGESGAVRGSVILRSHPVP